MDNGTDHIEDLERRLYARDPERMPKRKFGILRPIRQNVSSAWGTTEIPNNIPTHHRSAKGYKRFFIVSLIFFLIALSLALFSFFRGAMTLSSKNVELSILGNSFVAGGETLPIQIEIVNKNAADLLDVKLAVDYPKGATDESGADMVHVVKELGTIPSGKTKSEALSVVLYGEQGATREVRATLTYALAGSSALFEKEEQFSVMVNSSPFALTVDAPEAVGPNQPFTLTVRNLFTGEKTIKNTLVRVEYPNGFVYQSATPAPIAGNNVWELGDMSQGVENSISIKGRIVGEEGDEKSFRIYVGSRENEQESRLAVTYNSALHTAVLSTPFITGTIAANGQTGDIIAIPLGNQVQGLVSWTSSTQMPITNGIFTLALGGEGMTFENVSAENGYYDPLTRTISWTEQSNERLRTIDPGERGQLPFSFTIKGTTQDSADVVLGLSVQGTFPERDYAQATINTIDEKRIRFASRLQFGAQALYSVGQIKNTGPVPPKADQETTYTLTWTVRPTDNPLTNVRASATLPTGVVWGGIIMPQTEAVTYNPDTRLISWNIGSLPRATQTPKSRSVSFQVKVKPTRAQVGLELPLLGDTTVTATDAIANVPLSVIRQPLSTRLDTDPEYTLGEEVVVP